MNVPLTISAVVTSPLHLATLHELQTVYGSEDLMNFIEIMSVYRANERRMAQQQD